MEKIKATFQTQDEYIGSFPETVQNILQKLRSTIRELVPEADEKMSYQIPTFHLRGNLVHFAAFKTHIGFYPTPSAIEAFKKDLSPYEISKGTIKFPIDKPLPIDLISRIVQYRVQENLGRNHNKRK